MRFGRHAGAVARTAIDAAGEFFPLRRGGSLGGRRRGCDIKGRVDPVRNGDAAALGPA